MIWLTSDTHFCHDREFIFGPRGFSCVEEMNKAIVERWNSVVSDDDTVYHLGDTILNDIDSGIEYFKQLKGNIILIRGNHDTNNRVQRLINEKLIDENVLYADILRYKKYNFYLSHFPTLTENFDENHMSRATINLFAHTHQQNNFYGENPFMYHVGMDSHDCFPVSIDQIIEDIKTKINEKQ